jgi:Thoeris protein ThsB, TIR-like domain
MGYRDPTYVIFDGDEDRWAYAYMRGWRENKNVDFDFRDAHDLENMTSRAQGGRYVKEKLRERMEQSAAAVVLVGKKTKNLYVFVRWELELALELGLPIIVVNLNNRRAIDRDLCPPIIRDGVCAIHIPFKLAAIKYALDNWPASFRRKNASEKAKGPRHYTAKVYEQLQLEKDDQMSAFYIMRYLGRTGTGFGAIYIGKGTIVGVDVQNGRYHGTFMEDGGRIKVIATLSLAEGGTLVTGAQVSPGTKLPLSADWPADFANGSPQQIMVQGSPVQVAFEKVGDIP